MIVNLRAIAGRIFLRAGRVLPGLRGELRALDQLRQETLRQGLYPPGHYYSPIPDWRLVKCEVGGDLAQMKLRGIHLNEEKQLALLTSFAEGLGSEFWTRGGKLLGPRYSWPNNFFHWTDAGLLTHIISHFRPRKIVEVGCGFSSAVVSDAMERANLNPLPVRTLIDPSFARLKMLIPPEELCRFTLHEKVVQEIDPELFLSLTAGDILLIDSSHVTKHRSDVNLLVFDVLPQLAPGVLVHFHDVFLPFDYPADWYEQRWGWNEAFLLRAFLQFNSEFTILAFADFLHRRWPVEMAAALGGVAGAAGYGEAVPYASLWLQKEMKH